MTSMTVVSTGICAPCLLPAVSGGRFFSAAGFFALMPARRALDFAFFGVARLAANLRAGLALTVALDMLTEPDAGAGLGHDRRERGLADLKWITPQVVAI